MSKSFGTIFPATFAHFLSQCPILVVLWIFPFFHHYCTSGDVWSVVFNVTFAKISCMIR